MALSAAVPSQLIGFSGWAKQQDREVMAMARKINHAIDGFNAMPQNPRYIGPLPYIGDDLASLSAGMSAVDEWVGKVGHAFEQAGNQGTRTSSGDQWRSVQDATLTAAVTTPPPPTVQPGPHRPRFRPHQQRLNPITNRAGTSSLLGYVISWPLRMLELRLPRSSAGLC